MRERLTKRQKAILEGVVRLYVAQAQPVSSEQIVRSRSVAASPATVRSELHELTDRGLVAQPHTSAGRMPTDRGYRFFVDHLMRDADEDVAPPIESTFAELLLIAEPADFLRRASRLLADLTHHLAFAGFPDDEMLFHSGIGEVMGEPEFADRTLAQQLSRLADHFDQALDRGFAHRNVRDLEMFIGEENPIREARAYGMIVARQRTPFDRKSVVVLIGPKRMDYERNTALLKRLRDALEEGA